MQRCLDRRVRLESLTWNSWKHRQSVFVSLVSQCLLEGRMPSLLIQTGPCSGQFVVLTAPRITLGRNPDCTVVLDPRLVESSDGDTVPRISRQHAVIQRKGLEYFIADGDGISERSRNGTVVNGQAVPPPPNTILLNHGDQIKLCRFLCTFLLDGTGDSSDEKPLTVTSSLDSKHRAQILKAHPAEQVRVLLEISNDLSHTFDMESLLPRIVDHLLDLFPQADRGFILVSEEPDRLPTVRAFKARKREHERDKQVSLSIIRRCVSRMEAIRANEPSEEFPGSDSVVQLDVRSLICAPLWLPDNQPLGAIQLDCFGKDTRFTDEDLKFLLGVAGQASVAVIGARMHREALARLRRERDMATARDIQLALLPQTLPTLAGYAFHALYQSAQEIGGDYYDFVTLPRGRLAVLVGDVAGKGVPAALVMAKFSVEARICVQGEADLGSAISRLNDMMLPISLTDRFVTLVAMVLDPATHTLSVVNAGHPSPLVFRAGGEVKEAAPVVTSGLPLGILPEQVYTAQEVRLAPGDGLVLFSDGVVDAMNTLDEPFGSPRVCATLTSAGLTARYAAERLFKAVQAHAANCSQTDDIVLVSLGRIE
jgi:phosphoserine phosphatase RsbU/P